MITVTPVPGRPRNFDDEPAARAFIEALPECCGYIMVDPERDDPVIEQRPYTPHEGED